MIGWTHEEKKKVHLDDTGGSDSQDETQGIDNRLLTSRPPRNGCHRLLEETQGTHRSIKNDPPWRAILGEALKIGTFNGCPTIA